jgi:hypothetical protein
MYHDACQVTGVRAPAWVGRTTPGAVARAVVRAIKRDRPQILVNTPATRPLVVLSAISPSLVQWILRSFSAWRPFVEGASANVKAGGRLTGVACG